ncbi:MAG TPA: CsgG/HfaB family protein [Bdellovibrionales bacterium]|nr:CsgG/HfaB family protein [Bdellovibrionales bacterium]
MKKSLFTALALIVFCVTESRGAETRIPVSVTKFTNKSDESDRCNYGWYYWQSRIGAALQEMLVTELLKEPRIQVLERKTIAKIYKGEHELINSGNDKHALKKDAFKKAKITLVGALSEFEFCAEESEGGVNLGALVELAGAPSPIPPIKARGRGAKAKAVIDLRVIDVETGEIISSVTTEGHSNDSSFELDTGLFDIKNENSQPFAKAAREAIRKAADRIRPVILSRI